MQKKIEENLPESSKNGKFRILQNNFNIRKLHTIFFSKKMLENPKIFDFTFLYILKFFYICNKESKFFMKGHLFD